VYQSSKMSKRVIFFIFVSGSSHKQHMATRACVDVTRILDLSSCKPRANTQTLAVEFLVNAQKLIQGIIVPGNVHCLDSTRIPSPAGLYTHTLTCWAMRFLLTRASSSARLASHASGASPTTDHAKCLTNSLYVKRAPGSCRALSVGFLVC